MLEMCMKWLMSLSLLIVVLGFATVSSERWVRRSAILDQDRRFHLEWETGREDDIIFQVEVRTLGYVALGFSKDGTMKDSDFVVGWVSKGNVYLQDRYAEGNQMPELDRKQDYELISGSENGTHTVLKFKRKLDTCDCQDFALEYHNTIRVLYSYSYEDPKDEINIPSRGNFIRGYKSLMLLQPELERETDIQYMDLTVNDHNTIRVLYSYSYEDPKDEINIPSRGNFIRGYKSLMLLQPELERETDIQYMDLTVNDFAVSPEWDTMYWCKLFKAPEKKYHVTTFEPQILDGNQGHVHHMVWSECAGALPGEYEQYVGAEGFDCHDPNSPSFVRSCDGTIFGWGIGGEDVVLPDHFGIPVGPRPHYFMLQVHYDNANRDTGRPGTAGFKLHVTPHLRQHDGGIFIIGTALGVNFVVPPGMKDFIVPGHSNPDCLGPVIQEEGVMIHSAFLHTHYAGRGVKHRHFRDNKELEPIADNKHYDPIYQQYQILEEERLLLPWDRMTVECTFDTSNRTKTTFGGYSTREEMCVSWLMYYPKVEGVYGSLSRVQKRTMNKYIGSQDLISLTAGELNLDQTFVDYMEAYDWNRTAIRRFENKVRFSEQDTACYIGTGDLNTVETTSPYPEKFQEYVEPRSCSKDSKEKEDKAQSVKLNKMPHQSLNSGKGNHQEMKVESSRDLGLKVGDDHGKLNVGGNHERLKVKDGHHQGLKFEDGHQGLNDGASHRGFNKGEDYHQGVKVGVSHQRLNAGNVRQGHKVEDVRLEHKDEVVHYQKLNVGDSLYPGLNVKNSHHNEIQVAGDHPKEQKERDSVHQIEKAENSHQGLKTGDDHYQGLRLGDDHNQGQKSGNNQGLKVGHNHHQVEIQVDHEDNIHFQGPKLEKNHLQEEHQVDHEDNSHFQDPKLEKNHQQEEIQVDHEDNSHYQGPKLEKDHHQEEHQVDHEDNSHFQGLNIGKNHHQEEHQVDHEDNSHFQDPKLENNHHQEEIQVDHEDNSHYQGPKLEKNHHQEEHQDNSHFQGLNIGKNHHQEEIQVEHEDNSHYQGPNLEKNHHQEEHQVDHEDKSHYQDPKLENNQQQELNHQQGMEVGGNHPPQLQLQNHEGQNLRVNHPQEQTLGENYHGLKIGESYQGVKLAEIYNYGVNLEETHEGMRPNKKLLRTNT